MDDFYTICAILFLLVIILFIVFAPTGNLSMSTRTMTDDDKKSPTPSSLVHRIPHPSIIVKDIDKEKLVCFDPHMQSLNSRKFGNIGSNEDSDSLASFYQPANEGVPENFPVKPLGDCPYSKAQQHDIPVANLPMCMANQDHYNMRINLEDMHGQ